MPRVMVTGGAGFIGSHLAIALVQAGYEVAVLDDLSTGKLSNLEGWLDRIDFHQGDIREAGSIKPAARDTEVIFHLAALGSVPRSVEDPETTNEVNVRGTLNVLRAALAAGTRRVVLASSSSVYGDTPVSPKREDLCPLPRSPYAASKLAGEAYAAAFSRTYGLETYCLRYFNVFGPRQDPSSQYAAVVPKFITAALRGLPLTVEGDGEQTRDLTYVENVVAANMLAMSAGGADGTAVNIACADRISINDLARRIIELSGRDVPIRHVQPRAGDVRHSLADLALAQKMLGYRPLVNFADGIARTIAWYKQEAEKA